MSRRKNNRFGYLYFETQDSFRNDEPFTIFTCCKRGCSSKFNQIYSWSSNTCWFVKTWMNETPHSYKHWMGYAKFIIYWINVFLIIPIGVSRLREEALYVFENKENVCTMNTRSQTSQNIPCPQSPSDFVYQRCPSNNHENRNSQYPRPIVAYDTVRNISVGHSSCRSIHTRCIGFGGVYILFAFVY